MLVPHLPRTVFVAKETRVGFSFGYYLLNMVA